MVEIHIDKDHSRSRRASRAVTPDGSNSSGRIVLGTYGIPKIEDTTMQEGIPLDEDSDG